MIKIEDNCVGCPPEIGCLGNTCKYRNVKVFICDDCGCDSDELWYGDDGNMYCKYCITNHLERVDA